jgi:hypothetical protein
MRNNMKREKKHVNIINREEKQEKEKIFFVVMVNRDRQNASDEERKIIHCTTQHFVLLHLYKERNELFFLLTY